MNLQSLHDWLYGACRCGDAVTVLDLMAELTELRRGPQPETWNDLPQDGITMQQALERLEAEGKATREGSYWRWAPGKAKAAAETQRGLF